jgi:DegV family protein with EDD domain
MASGLPAALAAEYDIGLVPVYVNVGGRSYPADVAPLDAFWAAMEDPATAPTSAIGSPGDYLTHFRGRLRQARRVVYLHATGKATGLGEAARAGAAVEDLPVTIVDTQSGGMAQGFVAIAASRVANAGGSLAEVLAAAEAAMPRVGIGAVNDSLDLMIRSGRFAGAEEGMRGKFLLNTIREGANTIGGVFDTHADAVEALFAWVERRPARSRRLLSAATATRPPSGSSWSASNLAFARPVSTSAPTP